MLTATTPGLVITAADFGRDPDVNTEIVDLLTRGLITSATLITVSPHAEDALEKFEAAGLADSQLRLHLTLTHEPDVAPWSSLSGAPTLNDANGNLPELAQVMELSTTAEDFDAELNAQWQWAIDRGHRPVGLDTHRWAGYGLYGRSALADILDFCADKAIAFRMPRQMNPHLPAELEHLIRSANELADSFGVRLPRTCAGLMHRDDHDAEVREAIAALATFPDEGISEVLLSPTPGVRGSQLDIARDPIFRDALDRFDLRTIWA